MELRKQKVYKKVFDIARAELLQSDCEAQFSKAAVTYERCKDGFTVSVCYFDEIIELAIPEFAFKSSKAANVSLVTKIIILHYLNTANGILPGADKIPYEDVPGLRGYLPVFEKRVVKPLVSAFGFDKHAFLKAGTAMGGEAEEYGDASFTLLVLPRVSMTFILWEGDEEFPPAGKILFDRFVTGYLPLEDITVISKLAATRIIKEARLLSPYQ